jgi:pimeloyl-ACP methyl ester carboxylesterase
VTTLIIVVAVFCAGAIVTAVGVRLIERRHKPRGRFIDAGGYRQHIVEIGRATNGPPVVVLHGAGANLEEMNLALGERLAARHRVILVDRPGFGFSGRKRDEGSSPTYQAGVLRELLDQLGIERAIIVGHSWGGTLGLTFALDYPERVAGLVLVAPATHPGIWRLSRMNAFLASPIGWLFARTLALPFGAMFMKPGSRTAFLPQPMPQDYVNHSALMLVLRPPTLMNNWADIGVLDGFLAQQAARYGALDVPIIVFNGDSDPLVPPADHALKLAAAAPCVTVNVLPGFGHMLHHAAADRIAAAVAQLAAKS